MTVQLLLRATLGLALLLTACDSGSPPDEPSPSEQRSAAPTPTKPSSTPTAAPSGDGTSGETAEMSTCENELEGFEMGYPAGWHVNDPDTAGPCRVFDPQPFTLQPQSEIPQGLAVVVKMEHVSWERMREGDQEGEVLRREELTVAGREAVLLEIRAGQDAPLQEPGTLSYLYLVRVGPERTFIARTTDRGQMPYPDKQRVLDEIVTTLRFFGASA